MVGTIKYFSLINVLGITNFCVCSCFAQTALSNYVSTSAYNNMYPYMNNQMRTELNPGSTPSGATNPIDVVVKTKSLGNTRRVVSRSKNKTSARSAINTQNTYSNQRQSDNTNSVRSAAISQTSSSGRKVVSRARGTRSDSSYITRTATDSTTTTTVNVSTNRCFADYIECMDGFCKRENTKYNRCYCSSKLSTIDSEYQSNINNLINQIVALKAENIWTTDEMNEYWMSKIGKYTNTNSWTNIEDALDIDWATTESRVRGQNAFVTGHTYCQQHLSNCASAANNLRNAYIANIDRDCNSYKSSLQTLQSAAESLLEAYQD